MKRRIFFYGDSNTRGYIPGGRRLPEDSRFPNVAGTCLPGTEILVDALPGRNSAWMPAPGEEEFLGGNSFAEGYRNNAPLDALILMLGTNDVMPPLNLTSDDIAQNLRRIIRSARAMACTQTAILLVSPVPIAPSGIRDLCEGYGSKRRILEQNLSGPLERLACEEKTLFLDAGRLIPCADASDGFHLTAEAHHRLGVAVARLLAPALGLPQGPEA